MKATPQIVADWQKFAGAFSTIGPAAAYVGFSMGMIFGVPTVASMPSIKAAVFGFGGLASGGGIDDPRLRETLLEVASQLAHPEVLMLNVTDDEIFRVEDAHGFFDAIPGRRKSGRGRDLQDESCPPQIRQLGRTTNRCSSSPERTEGGIRLRLPADATGRPMTQLLVEAADALERRIFFDQFAARYDELRADSDRWAELEGERRIESGATAESSP